MIKLETYKRWEVLFPLMTDYHQLKEDKIPRNPLLYRSIPFFLLLPILFLIYPFIFSSSVSPASLLFPLL